MHHDPGVSLLVHRMLLDASLWMHTLLFIARLSYVYLSCHVQVQ